MSERLASALEGAPIDSAKPRFRWPMRVFLFVIVFDMVFHSLAVLLPYKEWCEELDVDQYPKRLPTRAEMAELAESAGDDTDPVAERVMESMDSLWSFFMPWADRYARKKITTWDDHARFGFCWLTTRLGFLEQLVHFEQKWTMFSPGVGRDEDLARGKLVYADGGVRVVRVSADPEDLTSYAHWFKERVLQYETKLDGDDDSRAGWCNLMAHRYPKNERGSPLVKIYLVKIHYDYPRPGEDPVEVMRQQNGPPGWRKKPPFYVYDVKTREGKTIKN